MPNEVSTPVDLPPFDFQLRGAVYNPLDWYWVMDDGRIYSSARNHDRCRRSTVSDMEGRPRSNQLAARR